MATLINAKTSGGGLEITPDTSGTISFQSAGVTKAGVNSTGLTGDGSQITALNATNLGSGTAPTARLGSGSATSSTFLRGDNTWAAAGGGKILQVLQVFKADTFSTTSVSLVDVTGLSIAITPAAATSKILVLVNTNGGASDNSAQTLVRDSTVIGGGTVTSSRTSSYGGSMYGFGQPSQAPYSVAYLDSPNTTSAVTYKVQVGAVGGGTTYLGRDTTDNDNAQHARTGQQITVMEVGA